MAWLVEAACRVFKAHPSIHACFMSPFSRVYALFSVSPKAPNRPDRLARRPLLFPVVSAPLGPGRSGATPLHPHPRPQPPATASRIFLFSDPDQVLWRFAKTRTVEPEKIPPETARESTTSADGAESGKV
jgi:hypothetical protein